MSAALEQISARFGCAITKGFGGRVIFKELPLKGLPMLDFEEDGDNALTISQLSARQEVRNLMLSIAPERFKPLPKMG